MKKKTLYNLIMVAIIVATVAAGLLGVGYIRGWFDQADGRPVLQQIVGVVHLERAGVSYNVGSDTVLRNGDRISAQTGATAAVSVGSGYVALGGGAELTVTDIDTPSLYLKAGELFVHATEPVSITFDRDDGQSSFAVENATVAISWRTGAQTVSVFRGTVEGISAGQAREYLKGTTTDAEIRVESLNSFTIAQIRKANQQVSLCVTNERLDDLEEKRRQELEDMLGGVTETPHEHDFEPSVVAATCTTEGYIEYRCACGERYQDGVTAAVGHRFGPWEVKQPATTQQEGLMERCCRNCDITEQKTLAKLTDSHTHQYIDEVVEPTCTTKGYTQHICTCGHSYQDSEVDALNHDFTTQVIKPTCTVQGYTLYRCACGHTEMRDIKPSTGHQWSSWTTVKEPTEEQTGLKEQTCAACGQKRETVLPATGQTSFVYITIRCDSILNNLADLNPSKAEFVPDNGVILPTVKVYYMEGETVFDVLQRVCAEMNIQMEYSWTPMYDSNYIEGINNLYEFDCGSQSGWMYKVNGWFPNYGVSRYEVSNGDQIVFAYTCKGLGTDVGAPEWEGD